MSLISGPVRTQRLVLRSATVDDAEATFAYRRLESVGQWLTEMPADVERYRATFNEPHRLAATVIAELDGRVIGDFMLRVEDASAQGEVAARARRSQAELGWVFDPAYTGRGYAAEAVRELLRICFEELGVRRAVATCFADNEASWILMERVGMTREAYGVRESLHRSGAWLDTVSYALLRDEWVAASRSRDWRSARDAAGNAQTVTTTLPNGALRNASSAAAASSSG